MPNKLLTNPQLEVELVAGRIGMTPLAMIIIIETWTGKLYMRTELLRVVRVLNSQGDLFLISKEVFIKGSLQHQKIEALACKFFFTYRLRAGSIQTTSTLAHYDLIFYQSHVFVLY